MNKEFKFDFNRSIDKWKSSLISIMPIAILVGFMVSFVLEIPSKIVNNYFYILMGIPGFIFAAMQHKEIVKFLNEYRFYVISFFVTTLICIWHGEIFKDSLYVFGFLFFIWGFVREEKNQIIAFAIFSGAIFFVYAFAIINNNHVITSPTWRLIFYGHADNPVYAASIMLSAMVYIWVFHIDSYMQRFEKPFLVFTLIIYSILVFLVLAQFEARSTIFGLIVFLVFYAWFKQLIGYLFFVIFLFSLVFAVYGVPDFLLQRGLSFRGEIWLDVFSHMKKNCSYLFGCGNDRRLFFNIYAHPHSAYIAFLYSTGVLSLAIFIVFAFDLFCKAIKCRSRWILVAVPGWFALLITTAGFYTSPKPLWIYFWLPTFFAMIEIYRSKTSADARRNVL